MGSASTLHLSFCDPVHHLDAAQQDPGAAKCFESQHGPGSPSDRTMVLLDQVIEIFGLVDLDGRCFTLGLMASSAGEIGAALVDSQRLRSAIPSDRFLKLPSGCRLVPMGSQ
jgi:hypothetical protein